TWDTQTGKCISKLEHQPHPHKISLDGTEEFEVNSNKITIRSIETSKICAVLQVGESRITAFQELSNKKLVAGNLDGEFYFWNQQRFLVNRSARSWLEQVFKQRGSFVTNFQELTDGRVAALARNGVVTIWDPFTYEIVETFETKYPAAYSMLVLK